MAAAQDQQQKILRHFLLVENCLIAEIHRLSALTPREFFSTDAAAPVSRLLPDFAYFENPKLVDETIENSEELRSLDDRLARKWRPFVAQFHKTLDEFCGLIGEFVDLRCDAIFLLGVVLLLINEKFPGIVKERVFVAHTRLNGGFHSKNFELMVALLRRRRENFESSFASLNLNREFVANMLTFLRSYTFVQASGGCRDQGTTEGLQHNNLVQDRFATTRQSAIIYVCLWFSPDVLHAQFPIMRQICDLYFTDNWIIPIHVDLTVNVLERSRPACCRWSASSTTPSVILDFNKHFQWLVLHSSEENKRSKKSAALAKEMNATSGMSEDDRFKCLLKIARFEYKFHQTCAYLIKHKQKESTKLKTRICNVFDQIAILLSSPAVDQAWNEQLKEWVLKLKTTVSELDLTSGEAIQVIEMQAEEQLVFIQYFHMIINDLNRLRGVCLVDESFVKRVTQQSEFVYLWSLLGLWIGRIEALLKEDALCVKFLFTKIANSIPHLLGGVVDEEKREVLSAFYHKKLEAALRRVIQVSFPSSFHSNESLLFPVIPRAIFAELDQLHPFFSTDTACLVEKAELKHLAQLDRRRQLAEKTSDITKLSLGISNMCMSRLGPVEIKPSALLFDGLKDELRSKLRSLLTTPMAEANFLQALDSNQQKLRKFRHAFVFVCEHVGINGVSLWHAQLGEIVREVLEREASKFEKVSRNVPGSCSSLLSACSSNCPPNKRDKPTHLLSHFVDVMLRQTNPKNSRFLPSADEWLAADQRKLEFSIHLFVCLDSWLPNVALVGLQKLVGCALNRRLRELSRRLERANSLVLRVVREQTARAIEGLTATPEFHELHARLVPILSEGESNPFLVPVYRNASFQIGHYAILNEELAYSLKQSGQSRLGHVQSSLKTLLAFVLLLVSSNPSTCFPAKSKAIKRTSERRSTPKMRISSKTVAAAGFASDVLEKVGIEEYCRETAGTCLFAVFVHYFTINAISNKKNDLVDHFVFVKGLTVALHQLDVWERFELLFRFVLVDTGVFGVIRQFRNVHSPSCP
ncbi:WASH complex subunit strumpellin [Aphelenchoides fujianensis]|nr:WASH complex subunit strumpellin [Aphelenchoides fujianensis]